MLHHERLELDERFLRRQPVVMPQRAFGGAVLCGARIVRCHSDRLVTMLLSFVLERQTARPADPLTRRYAESCTAVEIAQPMTKPS